VNVFSKRNALVGFVALKALSRWLERRRNRRRGVLRVTGFVALGLVSLGILAGVAAVALRRRGESDAPEAERTAGDDEIVGEHVTLPAEPIPAT
jgi:hypothetical protein